jgi:hypothetical protein
MDPRAGLDGVEKGNFLVLPGLPSLGHPAPSQSLYRPSYPGSSHTVNTPKKRNNTHTTLAFFFFSFFVTRQRNIIYRHNYV